MELEKTDNYYYANATMEADPAYHTHDDSCYKDVENTMTMRDIFGGTEETRTYTTKRCICGNPDGITWVKFVVLAKDKQEAIKLANDYADANIPKGYRRYTLKDRNDDGPGINLYHKNYIRESRALVAAGRYIGVKA